VNNDKLELKKLIKFSKILLAEGIKIAIPMRGAISFGQYNWGELIYGKAVLAAHRLEKIQKWIGIVIDLEILIENEEAFDLGLKQYFVPILNDESKLYYTVIWNIPFFHELSYSLALKTSHTKHLPYDKFSLEKIKNTAIFGDHLRKEK
jgi:hypothetical protein